MNLGMKLGKNARDKITCITLMRESIGNNLGPSRFVKILKAVFVISSCLCLDGRTHGGVLLLIVLASFGTVRGGAIVFG